MRDCGVTSQGAVADNSSRWQNGHLFVFSFEPNQVDYIAWAVSGDRVGLQVGCVQGARDEVRWWILQVGPHELTFNNEPRDRIGEPTEEAVEAEHFGKSVAAAMWSSS